MHRVQATTVHAGQPASVRKSGVGSGHSESRTLAEFHDAPLRLGTFVAEPGEYTNPGVPLCEWFIVIEGRGELHVDGQDSIPLSAGVVVHSDAHVAQRMTVTEKLSKVSLVGI
jgi:uncharacterized cupin superfamily protein